MVLRLVLVPAQPFNRVETNARVAILKHLREAEKDINKAFLVIGRKNTGLYFQVKAKNPDEWAAVSLSDAAKLVTDYRPESWPTLFATHKHIMGRPMEFVPQLQTQRLALTYDVRPENHVVALQRVVEMVREGVWSWMHLSRRSRSHGMSRRAESSQDTSL